MSQLHVLSDYVHTLLHNVQEKMHACTVSIESRTCSNVYCIGTIACCTSGKGKKRFEVI